MQICIITYLWVPQQRGNDSGWVEEGWGMGGGGRGGVWGTDSEDTFNSGQQFGRKKTEMDMKHCLVSDPIQNGQRGSCDQCVQMKCL